MQIKTFEIYCFGSPAESGTGILVQGTLSKDTYLPKPGDIFRLSLHGQKYVYKTQWKDIDYDKQHLIVYVKKA